MLFATVTAEAVTPDPLILSVAGETKLVPVSVTGVLVLTEAEDGLIDVRVGVGCATVKVTEPLVPLPVVTLTVYPPRVAALSMLKVAVICVLLTTDTLAVGAVTPEPEILSVTGKTKFVPVSMTGTLAPGAPDDGLTEVRVGAKDVTVNVRARVVPVDAVTVTL